MFAVPQTLEPATRRCEWIVCRGELHSVTSGDVQCPLGRTVAVETCLGCHWLQDADEDRSDLLDCRTQDGDLAWLGTTARFETQPSAASPLSLVVELL
jgi:hypothetical protein